MNNGLFGGYNKEHPLTNDSKIRGCTKLFSVY